MSFNFTAAVTIPSYFGAQENKICHCFQFFPIYLPGSDGTGCYDLSFIFFLMLSLKQAFSLSSFTFIKRLFSFCSLSTIRVVSSAYLRLLIFFLTIFPVCDSSSWAFHTMYSAYNFNKQSDDIQFCHTSFPIVNQSIVSWLVLTVAS